MTDLQLAADFDGPAEPARFRILAVDDNLDLMQSLATALAPRGFDLVAARCPDAALAQLERERDELDVVLVDRTLKVDSDGFDVLTRARTIAEDVSLIMLTGDQRDSTAAIALRLGAFHFIGKPVVDFDALTLTLLRAAHFSRLQRRARWLARRVSFDQRFKTLVGSSPAMLALYTLMSKVAETDLSVLIQGETGTGKELVARAIHDKSPRAKGPFVALNCGAIPEALIDSELFGHTKGAFTGAAEARPGVFVEANGGTLLLDEVGELSPAVQSRLLRALQEREVRPIGGSGTRRVDVRVIAATHVDLEGMIKLQRFRADLFYRLNVLAVKIPPLRERAEDIPLLVRHLCVKHSALLKRSVPQLTDALLQALVRYPWPGNVRELENILQSALALNSGSSLGLHVLPPQLVPPNTSLAPDGLVEVDPGSSGTFEIEDYKNARRHSIEAFDRAYFVALLKHTAGNVSEASRLSGMDRSNLRRALAKTGIRAIR